MFQKTFTLKLNDVISNKAFKPFGFLLRNRFDTEMPSIVPNSLQWNVTLIFLKAAFHCMEIGITFQIVKLWDKYKIFPM